MRRTRTSSNSACDNDSSSASNAAFSSAIAFLAFFSFSNSAPKSSSSFAWLDEECKDGIDGDVKWLALLLGVPGRLDARVGTEEALVLNLNLLKNRLSGGAPALCGVEGEWGAS